MGLYGQLQGLIFLKVFYIPFNIHILRVYKGVEGGSLCKISEYNKDVYSDRILLGCDNV
jgi:hypothetical protein